MAKEDFTKWTEYDPHGILTVSEEQAVCEWPPIGAPPPPDWPNVPVGPDFGPAFLYKARGVAANGLLYFSWDNETGDTFANDSTLLGWDDDIPQGGDGEPGNRPELDFFIQTSAGGNAV